MLREAIRVLDEYAPLDRVSKSTRHAFERAARSAPAVRALVRALNGTWLGHPLHPAITDVPIGAWTLAVLFDSLSLCGREGYARAADVAVDCGLAAALPAIVTGSIDWIAARSHGRRIGYVHGLANIASTGLYAASAIMRARGKARTVAVGCAYAGYACTVAAAYLGGDLVYEHRVGVRREPTPEPPSEFTRAIEEAAVPPNGLVRAQAGDYPLVLFRKDGGVGAVAELCPHKGGHLSEGELREGSVVCPWHNFAFALCDGHPVVGETPYSLDVFETRIREGYVEVRRSPLA